MVLSEGRPAACAAGVGGARGFGKDCAGEGFLAGGRGRRENRRRGIRTTPVGCPWATQIREGKEKVVDAAAAASEDTQADEEELFSGADGVGVHGEGLACSWGNCPHGETRPRTQVGRAESARLARGQLKDMEWRTKPHAGW